LFEGLSGFTLEGAEAAQLGQRVENDFLGLSTGIMDQFISRLGQEDHALFLDCRSLDYELVPAALDAAQFVIANTGVQRGLTASKYNDRVRECAEALAGIQAHLGVKGTHLRDIDATQLAACEGMLSDVVYRRARHVITEDERTQAACQALRDKDLTQLGALMNASDASLIDDYAVSCTELKTMTTIARTLKGCHGSRMTGAGFGGCTVSLVDTAHVQEFCATLKRDYESACGLESEIICSSPAAGARYATL
jgi:galactokinase